MPIVCCSARTGVGLDELLDALLLCGLSPADRSYTDSTGGEETEVTADVGGPLVAQVFKTRIDPFVQKLSFIRIFSGTLKKDATVPASTARKGVKVPQLLKVQADQTDQIDEAGPGEIVAMAKMEELRTGTTLGELTLPDIEFPTPMVG